MMATAHRLRFDKLTALSNVEGESPAVAEAMAGKLVPRDSYLGSLCHAMIALEE